MPCSPASRLWLRFQPRRNATENIKTAARTTLAIYDALLQANIPQAAARGVAEALDKDMEAVLATKADLAALEQRMEAQFERVWARFAKVDARLDLIETRLDQLETRLGQLESRFGQLEARLSQLESRFGQLETRVGQLETRIATQLENLELRMTIKLGSLILAGFTIVAAVLKFL